MVVTASYSACVTWYLPKSKDRVIVTRCAGFSSALHSASPAEQPIMKSPAGMFTKYMVLDLFPFLADGRKLGAPRKTRRNSLAGISVLKVYLTESLPLRPNRVNC